MEEMFNDFDEKKIVDQEGMLAVGELFNFLQSALEVAVQWIHLLTDRELDDIRHSITRNVKEYDFEKIMAKFNAVNTIKSEE